MESLVSYKWSIPLKLNPRQAKYNVYRAKTGHHAGLFVGSPSPSRPPPRFEKKRIHYFRAPSIRGKGSVGPETDLAAAKIFYDFLLTEGYRIVMCGMYRYSKIRGLLRKHMQKIMHERHPRSNDVREAFRLQKHLDSMKRMKRGGPLVCSACHDEVISLRHNKCCLTVGMWDAKRWCPRDDKKKCMMTYGLSGCTAIVAVLSDGSIAMSHDPMASYAVARILTKIPPHTSVKKLTVVSPQEYQECEATGRYMPVTPTLPAMPTSDSFEHLTYSTPSAVYQLPDGRMNILEI